MFPPTDSAKSTFDLFPTTDNVKDINPPRSLHHVVDIKGVSINFCRIW